MQGRCNTSHIVKMHNYIVMIIKEGSTKIVTIMNPGAGVFVLGRGQIVIYSEITLFPVYSSSSILWDMIQTT